MELGGNWLVAPVSVKVAPFSPKVAPVNVKVVPFRPKVAPVSVKPEPSSPIPKTKKLSGYEKPTQFFVLLKF